MPYPRPLLVVNTAATSTELLARPEQVCRELNVAIDAIPDVMELLQEATDAVQSITSRVWVAETIQETFRSDGSGAPFLLLGRHPVRSLTSVTEEGVAISLITDLEANPRTGELFRLSGDGRGWWTAQTIVVTYAAGHITPGDPAVTVPPIIQRATAMLAAHWHLNRGRDLTLRTDSVEGVGSRTFMDLKESDGGLPSGIMALLRPHITRRV